MSSFRLHLGDCRRVLSTLPAGHFHTCVTSPPYFGLRDYGTARWEGGDAACDHRQIRGGNGSASTKQVTSGGTQGYQFREVCGKCGAHRADSQIGLEPTPDEFVAAMVEVFREVKRVLRDDGTCWLNLGSSYAASGMGGNPEESEYRKQATNAGSLIPGRSPPPGFKPKDMIPIPWMVAMALQADGFYLRSDIIWHKPNPMPESVTDRPTKAHEYLFLLTKSDRYFYDSEAIKEPLEAAMAERYEREAERDMTAAVGSKNGQCRNDGGVVRLQKGACAKYIESGRNRRSVWTLSTKPFSEAHFATFPPELPELCIKAGTSEKGCCAECGAPWRRMTERERKATRPGVGSKVHGNEGLTSGNRDPLRHVTETRTVGWEASCGCGAAVVPCRALDPFNGAGTTGVVAVQLGRDYDGIELNPEYLAMAERRIKRARAPQTFRDDSKVDESPLFTPGRESA